ncbi:alanyl-tRNA editing protein [Rubrobacter indicoceani]|uniref:alanyl-tRNA editing protein n=1 Tax=Rubrobacter indicoceani TaxID=2051957 RepID=UPI000E5BE0D9|nr:alanyl-tRNA editing protein [Rubrobacter indicoceani]
MTLELFDRDAYLSEFTARVVRNSGREIVLDRTAFYPGGSGQPPDQGWLNVGPVNAKVIEVRRAEAEDGLDEEYEEYKDGGSEGGGSGGGERAASDEVIHVLDRAIPKTVREVDATLDWSRRHRNMRYNTALSLLRVAASRDLGAGPTVGRIRSTHARLDLVRTTVPVDDAGVRKVESAVNGAVSGGLEVSLRGGFSVAGFPPGEAGGLYVKNTSEIGEVELTRWMDRGSRGIRLEFTIPKTEA